MSEILSNPGEERDSRERYLNEIKNATSFSELIIIFSRLGDSIKDFSSESVLDTIYSIEKAIEANGPVAELQNLIATLPGTFDVDVCVERLVYSTLFLKAKDLGRVFYIVQVVIDTMSEYTEVDLDLLGRIKQLVDEQKFYIASILAHDLSKNLGLGDAVLRIISPFLKIEKRQKEPMAFPLDQSMLISLQVDLLLSLAQKAALSKDAQSYLERMKKVLIAEFMNGQIEEKKFTGRDILQLIINRATEAVYTSKDSKDQNACRDEVVKFLNNLLK